jgi:hypothetical protein
LIDEQVSICMLFSKQKKIWFSVWCLIITYWFPFQSNYIHASLPKKFAPKFRKKNLQEGKIYVVKQFEVLANKKSYAVVKNNSSMLQFNDDTTYSEVEDDDSILLHVFEFVKYAHLESRIDKHVLTGYFLICHS